MPDVCYHARHLKCLTCLSPPSASTSGPCRDLKTTIPLSVLVSPCEAFVISICYIPLQPPLLRNEIHTYLKSLLQQRRLKTNDPKTRDPTTHDPKTRDPKEAESPRGERPGGRSSGGKNSRGRCQGVGYATSSTHLPTYEPSRPHAK